MCDQIQNLFTKYYTIYYQISDQMGFGDQTAKVLVTKLVTKLLRIGNQTGNQ